MVLWNTFCIKDRLTYIELLLTAVATAHLLQEYSTFITDSIQYIIHDNRHKIGIKTPSPTKTQNTVAM